MARLIGAGLLVLQLQSGCDRTPSPGPRTDVAARLMPSEVIAYERGRLREIELTRAALQLVRQSRSDAQYAVLQSVADPVHMRSDAARALGITPDEYAQLVRRVDSALLVDTNEAAVASAHHLDSLRVTLVVLRSRLAAEVAEPFNPAAAPRSKP